LETQTRRLSPTEYAVGASRSSMCPQRRPTSVRRHTASIGSGGCSRPTRQSLTCLMYLFLTFSLALTLRPWAGNLPPRIKAAFIHTSLPSLSRCRDDPHPAVDRHSGPVATQRWRLRSLTFVSATASPTSAAEAAFLLDCLQPLYLTYSSF
jgi:hypothetical protein